MALLVGSIMAGQAASVKQAGWRLLAAVATLHAGSKTLNPKPPGFHAFMLPSLHVLLQELDWSVVGFRVYGNPKTLHRDHRLAQPESSSAVGRLHEPQLCWLGFRV